MKKEVKLDCNAAKENRCEYAKEGQCIFDGPMICLDTCSSWIGKKK